MEDHKNIQKFAKFYAQYSTIWSKQRGEKILKLFEEHNWGNVQSKVYIVGGTNNSHYVDSCAFQKPMFENSFPDFKYF